MHKANDMLEHLEYNAYIAYKAMIFEKLGIVNPAGEKEYAYNLAE